MAAGVEGTSAQMDRAALEEALSGHTAEQLKETAVRLSRSIEGLEEVLADMELEKKQLVEEGEELNNTISLIMQEMQKLKIGANNTVEPHLQEGALDFINRLWEKHRPRDTAYQTSEHVGEIRKPVPGEENQRPQQVRQAVQEATQQATQQVAKTAEKLQEKLGPWWARTQGFLAEKQSELVASMAARAAAQQQQQAPPPGKEKKSKRSKENDASAAGYPNGAGLGEIPVPPTGPARAAAPAEAAAAAAVPDAKKEETAAPAPSDAPAPTPEETAPAAPAAAPVPEKPAAAAEGTEDSTLVIKAELTLDDGTVKTLLVRAEDRTKEVAQRFVQENSLKAWFQEPLNKWLKMVENDTDTFPAMVEGNLLEIKKQFSKAPK